MATVRKPAAKMDAIGMLIADHKKVQKAFKDFEKLKQGGSKRGKSDIVRQTCADLTVHTMIEEEIFYPAARKAIKDMDVMDDQGRAERNVPEGAQDQARFECARRANGATQGRARIADIGGRWRRQGKARHGFGAQQSIDFTAVLASRKAARGCAAAVFPVTLRWGRRPRRPSPTVPAWICCPRSLETR